MRKRSIRIRSLAVASTIAFISSNFAYATTETWAGTTGNWNVGTNWSPTTVPAAGDTALLVTSDSTNRTVTLNVNSPTLAGLTVDSTGTGNITLSEGSNLHLYVGGNEYIRFLRQRHN